MLCWECRGVEPPTRGFGGSAPEIFFLDFCVHIWVVFWHMVFCQWFIFPVKELGLLTNTGHWIRVLDVVDSYMYIEL